MLIKATFIRFSKALIVLTIALIWGLFVQYTDYGFEDKNIFAFIFAYYFVFGGIAFVICFTLSLIGLGVKTTGNAIKQINNMR